MKYITSIKLSITIIGVFFIQIAFSQNKVTQDRKDNTIQEVCTILEKHYVYPEIASIICDSIRKSQKLGRFDTVTSWRLFADMLNKDFRSVINDQHLEATETNNTFKKELSKDDLVSRSFGFIARKKRFNFMMPKVEILENNIGYIEFTSFKPLPNPETERIVKSAMDFLSNSDALIIDLRRNGGGHTNMREFISSYFFNGQQPLSQIYKRETNSIYESFTIKDFYSRRLVDVPLFILTSGNTISAPEIFAYDLQALKRATVIGEVTAGSVNSGQFYTISNSISLLVATGYTTNPITQTNCEGNGVQPNIQIESEKALEKAIEVASVAAVRYREKKDKMVNQYANELLAELTKIELTLTNDPVVAEEQLNITIEHFYDIEYMDPYLLLDLGDWYLKNNKEAMAIFILKQGPKLYPGLMEIYIFYKYLAEAHLVIDDKKHAKYYYLKYLEIFPNDTITFEKLNKLIIDE